MNCVWCEKKLENNTFQRKFCCDQCRSNEYNTKIETKRKIRRIAKKYNLDIDIKTMIELTNKKVEMFKKKYEKCPMYPNNENRYCGCMKCLKEIFKEGQSRCGLFKEKKSE